ncbi:thioesterase domain-containing protein [Pleurocapsales cyanobacterium LEGE 06147]|nr:thioesterase domain-containing protein [Pleurocapsales cyanobacterium LEGE 06147]
MDIDYAMVEQYLHEHIPLSKTMAVSVTSINGNGVILSAPLLPNINHHSTVFGGSISAVAILSAWTFVHVQLQILSIPCRIVIQSNSIEYIKPIEEEFQAHCMTPPRQNWERFITAVSKRGKGRVILEVEVYSGGLLVGKFQGEYVALKLKETG